VNKTEGPNLAPMKQSKGLSLYLREMSTELIHKNSLPLTAYESQFSVKQKFHIAPKQRHLLSTEFLRNRLFITWLQLITSTA